MNKLNMNRARRAQVTKYTGRKRGQHIPTVKHQHGPWKTAKTQSDIADRALCLECGYMDRWFYTPKGIERSKAKMRFKSLGDAFSMASDAVTVTFQAVNDTAAAFKELNEYAAPKQEDRVVVPDLATPPAVETTDVISEPVSDDTDTSLSPVNYPIADRLDDLPEDDPAWNEVSIGDLDEMFPELTGALKEIAKEDAVAQDLAETPFVPDPAKKADIIAELHDKFGPPDYIGNRTPREVQEDAPTREIPVGSEDAVAATQGEFGFTQEMTTVVRLLETPDDQLLAATRDDLVLLCKHYGIKGYSKLNKQAIAGLIEIHRQEEETK